MATNNEDNNSDESCPRIQHVAKASSDELLRKFAQVGSESEDKKELQLAKRIKRSTNISAIKAGFYTQSRMYVDQGSSLNGISAAIVERKSLLPPVTPSSRRSSVAVVRRLGIGRVKVRAREIKHKSLLGAIEKTWRRTIEGACKVFVEKHYNQHRRLKHDMF
ncbi:unnamed protein product [Coffea canephora]|uniref:Uncharacterized protein n=2 Tax=Coffea TaxID=13442 RepID=A0A068UNP2_COFCA|nr:uncharacterized protein LOC113691913 [Coffea arabica]XP_027176809.1 uncharacterized protein LOC113775948 [Coffea eugenioides]CDP10145.1 unnamed protein product [Coffea canephora]